MAPPGWDIWEKFADLLQERHKEVYEAYQKALAKYRANLPLEAEFGLYSSPPDKPAGLISRNYDRQDAVQLVRDVHKDYIESIVEAKRREKREEGSDLTDEDRVQIYKKLWTSALGDEIHAYILSNLYMNVLQDGESGRIKNRQLWEMVGGYAEPVKKTKWTEDERDRFDLVDVSIAKRARHIVDFPDAPTNPLIMLSVIDAYERNRLIPDGSLAFLNKHVSHEGRVEGLPKDMVEAEADLVEFLDKLENSLQVIIDEMAITATGTGQSRTNQLVKNSRSAIEQGKHEFLPTFGETDEESRQRLRQAKLQKELSDKDSQRDAIEQVWLEERPEFPQNASSLEDPDEATALQEARDVLNEDAARLATLWTKEGYSTEEVGKAVYQLVVDRIKEIDNSFPERVAATRAQRQRGSVETLKAAKDTLKDWIDEQDFLAGRSPRNLTEERMEYLARILMNVGGIDNLDPYLIEQIPGWQDEKENLDLLAGGPKAIEKVLENLGVGSVVGETEYDKDIRDRILPIVHRSVAKLLLEDPTRTDIESHIKQILTQFPESNEEIWKQRMGREGVRTLSDPRLRALGVRSLPSPPPYLAQRPSPIPTEPIGPPPPTLTPTFGYTTERRAPSYLMGEKGETFPIEDRYRTGDRYRMGEKGEPFDPSVPIFGPPETSDIYPPYVQPPTGIGGLERRSPTSDIAQIIFNSGRYPAPPSQIDTLAGRPPVPTFETAPFYRPAPLPSISQSDLQETINRFAKGDKGLAFHLTKSMPEILQRFQSQYTGALKASRGEDITQRKQATLAKRYEAAGTPAERSRLQGEREKLDVRSEARRKEEVAAKQRSRDMWRQGRHQGPSKDLTYWLNFLKTFR